MPLKVYRKNSSGETKVKLHGRRHQIKEKLKEWTKLL